MSLAGVIDGLQFARARGELRGILDLKDLPRLADTPCKSSGIQFFLRGGVNPAGKAGIEIKATGKLELTCQRCLEPMEFSLNVDTSLELSADPGFIAQAEDDVDRVLLEPEMDVAQLVEDEIILILPLVPRHNLCDGNTLNIQPQKASPFGVLASLKRRGDQ